MTLNGNTGTEQRILVVDDEQSIVDAVATALRYEGYQVEEAYNGRDALDAVARFEPDLVVLDWMLPDIEGIQVGRRLRDQGFKTAVLFLTAKDGRRTRSRHCARAATTTSRSRSASPRSSRASRRSCGARPAFCPETSSASPTSSSTSGDTKSHRGETPITLTATEFSLLRYFMLNPRRVLSKGQILQNVWRYDFGGNSNVVETYVSYLRRKLHGAGPPLIKTVRQAGYMLEAGTK